MKEGIKVYLEKSNNPNRKTKCSLISAHKGNLLINIDSQVTNNVVANAISSNQVRELQNVDFLKREVSYGNSRFDIYYEKGDDKGFVEVKGVTLEVDGLSMFPDAPTKRGTKHVLELIQTVKEGYKSYIFFLIQIEGIGFFTPNEIMDKDFTKALLLAKKEGVNMLAYNSIITPNQISLGEKVRILI